MTKLHIILAFFASIVGYSQNINLTTGQVEALLCKTWQFDFLLTEGKQTLQRDLPHGRTYDYCFKDDFTLTVLSKDNIINKGSWCFDPQKSWIEIQISGDNTLRIIELENRRMIMCTKDGLSKDPKKLPSNYFQFSPR